MILKGIFLSGPSISSSTFASASRSSKWCVIINVLQRIYFSRILTLLFVSLMCCICPSCGVGVIVGRYLSVASMYEDVGWTWWSLWHTNQFSFRPLPLCGRLAIWQPDNTGQIARQHFKGIVRCYTYFKYSRSGLSNTDQIYVNLLPRLSVRKIVSRDFRNLHRIIYEHHTNSFKLIFSNMRYIESLFVYCMYVCLYLNRTFEICCSLFCDRFAESELITWSKNKPTM